MTPVIDRVERSVLAALETYSNVHRGSGHHSMVTTQLYERARSIVLAHLSLPAEKYHVIFCTPRRARRLESVLAPDSHRCVSSEDVGLPLGVRALAVRRRALRKAPLFDTGGGTAQLIGRTWAIWASAPDRFEAGTPAILNAIAFARALQSGSEALTSEPRAPAGSSEAWGELSGAPLLAQLRDTLVGRGGSVPTLDGERPFVNLDNAASTSTFAPIWQEVRRAWRAPAEARQGIVERAIRTCAEVLGASLEAHDIVFTSNTTEAINLVAESLGNEPKGDVEPVVLNTLIEHNSNELPWRSHGFPLVRVPMDEEGFIDLGDMESQLRAYNEARSHGKQRITLVAVSAVSNVLGVYSDVAEMARLAHRYGARLLVDGAQWVAHRKVDVATCGIDYLAFSGHKVYAPFGTGVLVARKGLLAFSAAELAEVRASGEENVGGIAGLGKSLELLQRIGFDAIQSEEQDLTRHALAGLAGMPHVKLFGMKSADSSRFAQKGGVILFGVKGRLPGTVARTLAWRGGIGVRCGCHCAHLTIKHLARVPPWAERLQQAMVYGIPGFSPPGMVRISFGLQTTRADVDVFLAEMRLPGKVRATGPLERRIDEFGEAASRRVLGPP
jgi:selenocysteine lyase/cysteine desulfurase